MRIRNIYQHLDFTDTLNTVSRPSTNIEKTTNYSEKTSQIIPLYQQVYDLLILHEKFKYSGQTW